MVGVFAPTDIDPFSGHRFADGIDSMTGRLGMQALCAAVVFIQTGVPTWTSIKDLEVPMGLCVGVEEEQVGLNILEHEQRGYDL